MRNRSYEEPAQEAKIDDPSEHDYLRSVRTESREDLPPRPHSEPPRAAGRGLRRSWSGSRATHRKRSGPRRIDLKKTLFVLPNAVTLVAVFCGFNAIRILAGTTPGENTDDFYRAAILLLLAMLFDLLDGRIARMTKTQSAFGLQLDSLADVISFGLAPALLVYQWVLYRLPLVGLLASFSFVACAAIRLARFNVISSTPLGEPTKPGKYIIGLPSPPASGILISLVVANHAMEDDSSLSDPRYTVAILIMTVCIGLLMVSNVPFRSFKDLKLNSSSVCFVLFVLLSSAFVWHHYSPQFVLVWLLSFYVLIGFVEALRVLSARFTQRNRTSSDS